MLTMMNSVSVERAACIWAKHMTGVITQTDHCSQRMCRQMTMMMMMMMIVAKDTEMGRPHACKKCSDRSSSSCLRRVMIRRIMHACKEECSSKWVGSFFNCQVVTYFVRKSFDEELVANSSQATHSSTQELDLVPTQHTFHLFLCLWVSLSSSLSLSLSLTIITQALQKGKPNLPSFMKDLARKNFWV